MPVLTIRPEASSAKPLRSGSASVRWDQPRSRRLACPAHSPGLAQAEQACGVLTQDEPLGLIAEITAIAHSRHRPGKDRVVVRKVGRKHDLVSADNAHHVWQVVLVWVEGDVALP